MTSPPSWTILVPTIGERGALLRRLLDGLLPQTLPYAGRVRVAGWFNNGHPSLPEIRQRMVERAGSDYVSFVDDDDLVAEDFVSSVAGALLAEPDYVGFQVQCYSDGAPTAIAYHSLHYNRWRNTPGRFYRDISHINPIRRELALKATFRRTKAGGAEDRAWADQLRRAKVLGAEVMIDRIMYHYLYSTSTAPGLGSRWETRHKLHPGSERIDVQHPNFSWMDQA